MNLLKTFNSELIKCRLCPRLVSFRESVPASPGLKNEEYWRKPVPGFGDPEAWLLLLGLAPSSQGGNRTGRIFTGDKSAVFLMEGLHKAGFANQNFSISRNDRLKLAGCYMTAAVKCVPPMHKPNSEEMGRCMSLYLYREIAILKNLTAVLALGQLAFNAYFSWLKSLGFKGSKPFFTHGGFYPIKGFPTLYASYHPSPQNTNTGVLTQEMFLTLLEKIKNDHCKLF